MPDLTSVAQELYGLLPSEFTGARNARVRQLRGEDRALAEAVGALAKPATAAWVLNQLVRHHADVVGQVVELGESLRRAQEELSGDALRDLNRQRRRLTAAVTRQARDLGVQLGVKVSDAVADQVEESLRAAMTDATAAAALRTGLLVKPLSSTGLGDLDVATVVAVPDALGAEAPARARLSVVGRQKQGGRAGRGEGKRAAQRRKELREAEDAVTAAEQDAAEAEQELTASGKRVAELEARSLQLQSELEEVRRRAADLEHELEALDDEISAAEDDRDEARDTHDEAVTELDRARSALQQLQER